MTNISPTISERMNNATPERIICLFLQSSTAKIEDEMGGYLNFAIAWKSPKQDFETVLDFAVSAVMLECADMINCFPNTALSGGKKLFYCTRHYTYLQSVFEGWNF